MISVSELRDALREPTPADLSSGRLLRAALSAFGSFPEREQREIVIRLLAVSEQMPEYAQVLDDLARSVGLFPYIADPAGLSGRDAIALEYHRPEGLSDDIVFHSAQALVYRRLLRGENVILSAPTSFGKSLIIDAMIATERYNNVVVVVPTLALVDESRRRLVRKFGQRFKVVTHADQKLEEKNIFVSTQERLAGREDDIPADFLVVDEFYKLSPDREDERFALLNQVLYAFARRGIQFYLLGPNISSVPAPTEGPFSYVFHHEDFNTVVTEVAKINAESGARPEELRDLLRSLDGSSVIYCQSPRSARTVALSLSEDNQIADYNPLSVIQDAVEWLSEQYHQDWSFVRALRRGIGIHHGSVPRSWSQFIVKCFNDGFLSTLVCTSTLIEGVNTTAKNVVIYDNKVGWRRFDFFTFANIRGRSGRMGEHFIGHVYTFDDPPEEKLPFVDLPVLTQGESTPDKLLVQMSEDDLTEQSQRRLESVLDESVLPTEAVRQATGVSPKLLIEFGRKIRANPSQTHRYLGWQGIPSSPVLKKFIEVIWDSFELSRGKGVASASQLHFRLRRLQYNSLKEMINQEVANKPYVRDADQAVENVLGFMRNWAGFKVPRLIRAADIVQKYIFDDLGFEPGSYLSYADAVESHFLPPVYQALEEYGLPSQVSNKLRERVNMSQSLDDVLTDLYSLPRTLNELSAFEQRLLADFIRDVKPK